MSHMQKRHGLFVPSPNNLIVDLETLFGYFHLVIFDYAECLFCGSARKSPQAAQQHMTGKGHCRIDITKDESEFRDFYDFHDVPGTDSDENGKANKNPKEDRFIDVDEKTRRLASGKILSHRSAKKARAYRPVMVDDQSTTDVLLEEGQASRRATSKTLALSGNNKKELASAERRDLLFNKQLATLRPGDRQALMHLPLSQQWALVAKAKKQQEKWNREQIAQEIKRQLKANP
ncbi:core trichothecene cluster (CTC) protein 15 [Colletotrichum spaethianum]|uniref:Core trichothecene cluster (CTC) protein 15 n=1 Tax=Colletotrichum spaethianum TaxID=700344 RepID=A0AA37LA64_9PEZI|nr:core trichothecene cluster (CTC) protein 15 [Colletotrichum spaethianum]GKT42869.1 core trichothecene cluster (CTC) protein 15 [Colletotrichum spaethianum]